MADENKTGDRFDLQGMLSRWGSGEITDPLIEAERRDLKREKLKQALLRPFVLSASLKKSLHENLLPIGLGFGFVLTAFWTCSPAAILATTGYISIQASLFTSDACKHSVLDITPRRWHFGLSAFAGLFLTFIGWVPWSSNLRPSYEAVASEVARWCPKEGAANTFDAPGLPGLLGWKGSWTVSSAHYQRVIRKDYDGRGEPIPSFPPEDIAYLTIHLESREIDFVTGPYTYQDNFSRQPQCPIPRAGNPEAAPR